MVNYANGKIYKLVNNVDDEIYIGSTCNTLTKRKNDHKSMSKSKPNMRVYQHLIQIGWDNVEIVLIENHSCINMDELHRIERFWIDELKPKLNKYIPTRTIEEWYDDNKEVISQKRKEYQQKNKEVIAQTYVNNKEVILHKMKQYRQNNKQLIAERKKQYRQNNKEVIFERNKQFRQNNKQLIAEQRKQYRQKNKEVISQIGKQTTDCRCGAIVRVDSHTRHNRTQKHQFYVNLLDYINS